VGCDSCRKLLLAFPKQILGAPFLITSHQMVMCVTSCNSELAIILSKERRAAMKEKELDEPVTRVLEAIENAGDERQRQEATETDVVHMFAEELAEELRSKWKEQLDSDLRDRALRGFFR
jgi:beta-glucosidase-like glycosyl hydrolase